MSDALRSIPPVEKVLQALGAIDLPRPVITALVRRELASFRGGEKPVPTFQAILSDIRTALHQLKQSRIQPVINATGILLHTNLGRAPLASEVIETLKQTAAGYCNLEYDLESGERGSRGAYLEDSLALLCQAEAATVVNNCAAALVLTLTHLTRIKREVVISRGELIQIGGGFRIPEILEASGARLREVGTTNKTFLADYARAVGAETGLILKVHQSNFFMGGFVEAPSTEELAALARERGVPLVEDLGSGAVIATEGVPGVAHEPTPAEVLQRGVQLVLCSGDKLLGGPQSGILAGQAALVAALKREPLFRALRCDKLVLSGLQATVDLYLSGAAEQSIPVVTMLQISLDELRRRAETLIAKLSGLPLEASVGVGDAQLGGGTLPRSVLPSVTLDLIPRDVSLSALAARLRRASPAVVGYISGGKFKLDLRTVFVRQDDELARAVAGAFA